jgi:parvulin-like peptidyl-prolyl isomerase
MKKALFLLPILLLVAAVLAGCGGGGGAAKLASDDIAAVGQTHVTQSEYDALLAQAKQSYKQQGKAFPKQGTTDYETVKSQVVTLLVQQAEREEKARTEALTVSDKQIEARLTQIKKQYFGGSEKKYRAQLKQQHLTDAQVRDDVRAQLVSEAVFNRVTKDVKVTSADVDAYYKAHQSQYTKAQTRDVQYILVKAKPLATTIYTKLKAGNAQTWCKLAKKYSQDPSSKNTCGKATFSKGQTVPEFDRVLFSAQQNQVHAPIHSAQYGWFVIQPTSAVHAKSTTPEKQVSSTIKQTLLTQKKNKAMTGWVSDLPKTYCSDSKIRYQVGFMPTPGPCTSTTNQTTT